MQDEIEPSMATTLVETTRSWKEVMHEMRPLDVLLFRGSDAISDLIATAEREAGDNGGEFSHAGIVVTHELLPEVPGLLPGKVYVAESTCSFTFGGVMGDQPPDVVTGRGAWGVQIRDLSELVPSYLGTNPSEAAIAWCPLTTNPWEVEADRSGLAEKAMKMAYEFAGAPYDASLLDLLSTIIPWLRPARQVWKKVEGVEHFVLTNLGIRDKMFDPSTWVFCSQLVATILQRLGVLDGSVDPDDVTPSDFLGPGRGGRLPLVVSKVVRISVGDDNGMCACE